MFHPKATDPRRPPVLERVDTDSRIQRVGPPATWRSSLCLPCTGCTRAFEPVCASVDPPPPGWNVVTEPRRRGARSYRHGRTRRRILTLALTAAVAAASVSGGVFPQSARHGVSRSAAAPAAATPASPGCPTTGGSAATTCRKVVKATYPWHRRIVSTTFWVGEVFDVGAADGSQVYSTYDDAWQRHYGGCDGILVSKVCRTERRTAANGYYPTSMKPRENPFYLDLPFDDVNDPIALASRMRVVPWAGRLSAARATDQRVSLMKNQWVELRRGSHRCFGQVEDAGPGKYHDARYVFGTKDQRPANRRYGGAGIDVSPALNGCLGFRELNGQGDRVDWRFVDAKDVPAGPWRRIVTTSGVWNVDG